MYIPFETLPAHARLWLYHVPRPLTEVEKQTITEKLQHFCKNWEAHNVPLQTSFTFLHEQFIALAVDENIERPSGCSIDGSVRVIREIGGFLNADLFKRQYAMYWEGEILLASSLADFKKKAFTDSLEVFDQTVATIGELQKRKKINIKETWLKNLVGG